MVVLILDLVIISYCNVFLFFLSQFFCRQFVFDCNFIVRWPGLGGSLVGFRGSTLFCIF